METIGLALIAIVLFEMFKSKAATPPQTPDASSTGNGQSGSPKKPFLGVEFKFANQGDAMAEALRRQAAKQAAEAKAKAKKEKEAAEAKKKIRDLLAGLGSGGGGNEPAAPPAGGQGGLPPNNPQQRYQRATAVTVVELEGVVMSATPEYRDDGGATKHSPAARGILGALLALFGERVLAMQGSGWYQTLQTATDAYYESAIKTKRLDKISFGHPDRRDADAVASADRERGQRILSDVLIAFNCLTDLANGDDSEKERGRFGRLKPRSCLSMFVEVTNDWWWPAQDVEILAATGGPPVIVRTVKIPGAAEIVLSGGFKGVDPSIAATVESLVNAVDPSLTTQDVVAQVQQLFALPS